jgi:hypothetical protein
VAYLNIDKNLDSAAVLADAEILDSVNQPEQSESESDPNDLVPADLISNRKAISYVNDLRDYLMSLSEDSETHLNDLYKLETYLLSIGKIKQSKISDYFH